MNKINRCFFTALIIIFGGRCDVVLSGTDSPDYPGRWEVSLAKANISLEDDGGYNTNVFMTGSGTPNPAEADSLGLNVAYIHKKHYLVRLGVSNINYKRSSYFDNSEFFGEAGYRLYPFDTLPLAVSAHLGYSGISSSGLNFLSSRSDGSGDHGVNGGLYISGSLDYFITEKWGVGLEYRIYSVADFQSAAGVHLSVAF